MFNFRNLHCDILQTIGHRELILTCILALLTRRKTCDVDLNGQHNVTRILKVKGQDHSAIALNDDILNSVFGR